jgi:hypothetical protein
MGLFGGSRSRSSIRNDNYNIDNKQDNRIGEIDNSSSVDIDNDIDNSTNTEIDNEIDNSIGDNSLNFSNSSGDINITATNSDDFNNLLKTSETLFSDLNKTQIEQVKSSNSALSNIATLKSGERVEQIKPKDDSNLTTIVGVVVVATGLITLYKFLK